MTDKLLTVNEAAAILRLGRGTTLKLMDSGQLPYLRVGERKRMVTTADLAAYVERGRITNNQQVVRDGAA